MSERYDDELLRRDETLLDDHEIDDAPGELPQDAELREELMRQRLAHGMLRTLYGRNEFARERRVRDIIEALPPLQEASRRVFSIRPGLSLAAAILVSGIIATVFLWGSEGLEAKRLMAEALDIFDEEVDRRYTLKVEQLVASSPSGGVEFELCGEHQIMVRPGKLHMLLDGKYVGKWEMGCDGYEMWRREIGEHGQLGPVEIRPMAEQFEMMKDFMRGGLIDQGYLDIARVVRAIPDDTLMHVGERKTLVEGGPILTPIHIDHDFKFLGGDVDELVVWIETESDFVHCMTFEVEDHIFDRDEVFRLDFEFVGVVPAKDLDDPYSPPEQPK